MNAFRFSNGTTRLTCTMALALLLAQSVGCTRTWYRRQADADAYNLVYEKVTHPHWDQSDYTIVIDPQSRMYDPYCPDHEPMPPDDPAAHEFMHKVDRKKGYPWWHINGDTPIVENPAWVTSLPMDEEGRVVLSASEAVRQGFVHSREYQRELEEVYLSALDVAFERFRFDTQFQAPFAVFGDWTAKDNLSGRHSNLGVQTAGLQSPVVGSKVVGSKAFTTGSNLVVGFANSMVWQFAGPDTQTSRSVIDFNLIQPLLRGAGRDRVLERLTVSERTLLSNVRAMERYRQSHYVRIMTGRDPGQGPQRRGGVGGAGLEGFTGTGSGFGNIVTQSGGGGGGAANAGAGGGGAGAGAGSASGYIGLLQNLQEIRNQEDNIQRLRDNASRLDTRLLELLTTRAAANVVLRQRLQVAQARQAVINAQSRLLNSRNTFEANVDNFKVVLGLPPTLCVTIEDNFADEYQLIDAEINERQTDIQTIIDDVADANRSVLELLTETAESDEGRPARRLTLTPELQSRLAQLRETIDPVDTLQKTLRQSILKLLRDDFSKFQKGLPRRKKQLQALEETYNRERDTLCELLPVKGLDSTIFSTDRLDNQASEFKEELERVTKAIGGYESRLAALRREIAKFVAEKRETLPPQPKQDEGEDAGAVSPEEMEAEEDAAMAEEELPAPGADEEAPAPPGEETRLFDDDEQRFVDVRDKVLLASQNLLSDLRTDVLAMQLLEARLRTESVSLNEVNLQAENALKLARKYRHDWLNARASLVDSWRLIEFNADQLESQLDIVFSGDISTIGNNPASFRSSTGHLRAGVQFDSPLTRLSERNVYRQSLIEYQQARRSFYAFEDNVARSLRQQLRQVAVNQINFELQRFAVLQAAGQISINDDIRADQEARSQTAGDTAARDSVSALSDLLDAQNNFLSVFINYEVLRRQLDLDLGTMQLDSDGNWLDPGTITDEYGVNLYGDDDCDFLPPLPAQIELDLRCAGDSLICSASRSRTTERPGEMEEEMPHEKAVREALARRAPRTKLPQGKVTTKAPAKLAAAKAENIIVASWWEEIAGGSAVDRQAIDADPPPIDESYEELLPEEPLEVEEEMPPAAVKDLDSAPTTTTQRNDGPVNPFRAG